MKNYYIFIIISFLFIIHPPLFSQTGREIDSLTQLINSPSSSDTTKVSALLSLGETIYMNNPDSAMLLFKQAKTFAEKALRKENTPKISKILNLHLSTAYNNIGFIHSINGDILKALDNYLKSLYIRKKIKNKERVASSLINIGYVYYSLGDLPKALDYFTKALKIKETLHDTAGIIIARNNIAHIYSLQKNNEKALKIYKQTLNMAEKAGLPNQTALLNNNIGQIYMKMNKLDSAIYFINKSLKINITANNEYEQSFNYQNLAKIYSDLGNKDTALYLLHKALHLKEKLNEQSGLASVYSLLADIYWQINELDKAEYYGKLSYELSKKLGYPQDIATSAELLRRIYIQKRDYQKAYQYLWESKQMNDSIINENNKQTLVKQQLKYEYEKKAALDSLAHIKELQIKNLEIKKQAEQKNILIVGLFITLLVVVYIYRNYKQKAQMNLLLNEQKAELQVLNENLNQQNEEIKAQRDEIEEQKQLIESIYNELSESINYAQHLQHTIFPPDNILKENISSFFILFKPKDKVSGDFYWWTKTDNNLIITVADCTGHGVPGAFMSMLGITLLKEIVEHDRITDTVKILRLMRREIINTLNQKGKLSEHKDGIDMTIINYNLKSHTVQFSGANNKAILIADNFDINSRFVEGEIQKLKEEAQSDNKILVSLLPDKMPVGIYQKLNKFTSVTFKIQEGDIIYMFSDGYADQFGGKKMKKFKYNNLRNILLTISDQPMDKQRDILDKEFENWKNGYEQIDDVTIGGFKLL